MTTASQPLPALAAQAERLVELGLHDLAGLSSDELTAAVAQAGPGPGLLVLHPHRLAASVLTPAVHVDGRPAFVVADLDDLDAFPAIEVAAPPPSALYVVHGIDRGDALRGWSPDEALPAIASSGRTPLTVSEGLHWLLQQPSALERNACFMTIGSRLRRPSGRLDPRTPAIWLSNGTGRDGPARRHAPKVGWCWAGNRHTWLGFATAAGRTALPGPPPRAPGGASGALGQDG